MMNLKPMFTRTRFRTGAVVFFLAGMFLLSCASNPPQQHRSDSDSASSTAATPAAAADTCCNRLPVAVTPFTLSAPTDRVSFYNERLAKYNRALLALDKKNPAAADSAVSYYRCCFGTGQTAELKDSALAVFFAFYYPFARGFQTGLSPATFDEHSGKLKENPAVVARRKELALHGISTFTLEGTYLTGENGDWLRKNLNDAVSPDGQIYLAAIAIENHSREMLYRESEKDFSDSVLIASWKALQHFDTLAAKKSSFVQQWSVQHRKSLLKLVLFGSENCPLFAESTNAIGPLPYTKNVFAVFVSDSSASPALHSMMEHYTTLLQKSGYHLSPAIRKEMTDQYLQ